MKYLVMECHLSYAVVLDEEGRFLKVANRNYEVGQTVTNVIEMQVPQPVPQKKKQNKWVYSLATMAACLVLMVTALFQNGQQPYASVYMSINPQVRIDVNRKDVVVGIAGVNADGEDLIEGYKYSKKTLDLVMGELIDRAIDMDYLHEGGQISLELDADNDEWVVSHSDHLTTHINSHLSQKITVSVEVTQKHTPTQIVIPVVPEADDEEGSDYGDSDYGSSDYGDSDYGDSDYGTQLTPTPTDSSYDDAASDYEAESAYDDPVSDYESNSSFDNDDAASDYEDSSTDDGSDYEDGETDYGNASIEEDPASDYEDSSDDSLYDSEDEDEDEEDSSDYEDE